MGQRTNRHFSKEDKQVANKQKMLNIIHYQRNPNQNHNEVPSHAGQNGCYQKVHKQILQRMWRKVNCFKLFVGMQIGAAAMENSVEIP